MSPPWRNGRRQTEALLRGHVAPLEMGRASFCLAGMVAGRGCGALCAALPPQARPWEPILGEREALRPHSAQVSIQLRRFSSHPADCLSLRHTLWRQVDRRSCQGACCSQS